MLKDNRNRKGITLIALIITIIVMLILAGVSLNALVGDNGLITNSQAAAFKSAMSQYLEDTEIYAANLEAEALDNDEINYDETEGARKYFYAGDVTSSGNATYAERFNENLLNIANLSSGNIVIKNTSWESFTKMDNDYHRSRLAVEEGYLTWFCDYENDPDYENEVKWCLEVGLRVFDINRGYINSIDGSGNIVVDSGSDGSYGNSVGKSSGVQSNGVFCCSPDLSTGWNTGKTYYVTYSNVNSQGVPGNLVYKAPPSDWYDYGANKWANIVTVNHGQMAYWTWIPRYAVKVNTFTNLVATTSGATDVRFVDTNNTYKILEDGVIKEYQANSVEMADFVVPDAFSFNGKQLSGIWVAKYEVTVPAEAIGFNVKSDSSSITITSLTFEGTNFSSDTNEDIRTSAIDIFVDGVKNNSDGETVVLGKKIDDTHDYTNGYVIKNLDPEKEYDIKVVIKSKLMEELDMDVSKKVRTTKGGLNSSVAGADNIVEPDLSGFNLNNTYYATISGSDISKGAAITVDSNGHATNAPDGWYDYANQKWANIMTLNQNNDEHNGEMAIWVWVPRYEFKVDNKLKSVDTVFIPQSQTKPDSGYEIPDAFKFDGKELAGIWVAKYEVADPRLPSGFTTKALANGFEITNILYTGGSTGSTESLSGTVHISGNGVNKTQNFKVGENSAKITGLTTAGIYTVEVTVNRSFKKVGGAEYPITITQTVYVSGNATANAPDVSGFKNSTNHVYYVTYDDVNKAGKIAGEVFTNGNTNSAPSNWYDYNSNKYANILISKTALSVGTVCDENGLVNAKDVTMWVWVPRYQFKVENNSQVNWVAGTGNASGNGYEIPDAFKFDGKELTGIWVGKYEINGD